VASDIKQVLYYVDTKSVGQSLRAICKRKKKTMRIARVKAFFVLNPGAIFIMLFAALVLVCAYLLILGNLSNSPIDSVAVLAYSCLVIGIILQAVGFIRDRALGERV
jgi:hypothetical protein